MVEHAIADGGERVGKGNGSEVLTTPKGSIADGGNGVGKGDRGQVFAF